MAIHGTDPAKLPKRNGAQLAEGPGLLVVSMSQPKKIIDAFTPPSASSAATSVMPTTPAIRTTMTDDDNEYSTQRKRFLVFSSSAR